MFVNQDDHARNFSFICDSDYKWRATPAYDITFAKGAKQTREHQLTLNSKALSQITLQDVVNLATEFVSDSITKIKALRDIELPKLMPRVPSIQTEAETSARSGNVKRLSRRTRWIATIYLQN